jgi:hypothetical protein
MTVKNAGLVGLPGVGVAVPTAASAKAEPVVIAQTDDQASSPSLEQVLQDARSNAFSYLDTSTYLRSLFKA